MTIHSKAAMRNKGRINEIKKCSIEKSLTRFMSFIYWTSLKIAREFDTNAELCFPTKTKRGEGWNRCEGQAKGGGGAMGNDIMPCVSVCVSSHMNSLTLWQISHVFELEHFVQPQINEWCTRPHVCVCEPKLIECEQTKWNGMSSKAHHTHAVCAKLFTHHRMENTILISGKKQSMMRKSAPKNYCFQSIWRNTHTQAQRTSQSKRMIFFGVLKISWLAKWMHHRIFENMVPMQ